jgi:hypothetical protein
MFKIKPENTDAIDDLIHGRDGVENWILKEMAKYKKE